MTLEFNRVVEQVYRMGAMLEKLDFDLSDLLERARLQCVASTDLRAVRERIAWARQSNISGYRGAVPLDGDHAEPINARIPAPPTPERAVLLACDGSQIYPDEQAAVHYYLINIGLFVYYHGITRTPEQISTPELKFHRAHVHDRYGRIVSNRTVDDRRTLKEMLTLARATAERRDSDAPLLALYDNRLMFLPANDADDPHEQLQNFLKAMRQIRDSNAALAGYIDNPHRSKRFIQLLFLLTLNSPQELHDRQRELSRCGEYEGLRDRDFFQMYLREGERSAIMVQNSPQNKEYKDEDPELEVAFFYLKVGNAYAKRVVRVDLPIWVARDRAKVDLVHAFLLEQCRLQGRNPYPYVLTRADELAYVSGKDSAKLQELVNVQVRRVMQRLTTSEATTAKTRGKELARGEKRYWNAKGDEVIDER